MKNFLFSTIALCAFSSSAVAQTPFIVDATKSTFKWTAKKVTGSHWGNAKVSNGILYVENGNIKNGNVTMDMNSIEVKDLEAAKGGDKLAGHLKAEDFFNTAKHPTAKLTLKTVTAAEGGGVTCVGDLTIKDITKEITFPATVAYVDNLMTATADFKIDRTQWDIKYGSGSFFENLGNKAIDNDFEVSVKIEAASEKPAPPAAVAPTKTTKSTKKNTRKVQKSH
jgi:polyisoprenoid-binding protein YceI